MMLKPMSFVFSLLFFIIHSVEFDLQVDVHYEENKIQNLDKYLLSKYDETDFRMNVQSRVCLILFHNYKCETCKTIISLLEEMIHKLEDRQIMEPVIIATIDCDDVAPTLCQEMKLASLPTLAVYNKNKIPSVTFSGEMSLSHIKGFTHDVESFMKEYLGFYKNQPDGVRSLDGSNFEEHISIGRHFVKFYVPWCQDCQQLTKTWEELDKSLQDNDFISISKIDCSTSEVICDDHKIVSYPTLIYFKDGYQVEKYGGPTDHSSLKVFISSLKPYHSMKSVKELTTVNFNETTSKGTTLVRFYDDQCLKCQHALHGWYDLVEDVLMADEGIRMAEINCRKNKPKCFEQFVYSVPAIVFYKNGVRVDLFRGSHSSLADLRQFLSLLKDKEEYELPPPNLNYVTKLKEDSLNKMTMSDDFVFVKFFVPWCEFCKVLSPVWEQLAIKMYRNDQVSIAEVNCSEQDNICQHVQIRGYPTMLLFRKGQVMDMYTGDHDVTSMHDYLVSMISMATINAHHSREL